MNILKQASSIVRRKWSNVGKGWKVFLTIVIVLLIVVGIAYFIGWLITKALKGLAVSGGKRDYSLYFPAGRSRR